MHRFLGLITVLCVTTLAATAFGCPSCPLASAVRRSFWSESFWRNLLWLISVPLLTGLIAGAFYAAGRSQAAAKSPRAIPPLGELICAGFLLGAGLGGFFDGILLHQILQWHSMLSSVVPPVTLEAMKFNMLWDGIFHALTWLMVAAGVALLWNSTRRAEVPWPTSLLLGSMSLGWGCFNLVEGVIDHLILGIHHVHPGVDELIWDVAFLLTGVLLVAGGAALIRLGSTDLRRAIKSRQHVPSAP